MSLLVTCVVGALVVAFVRWVDHCHEVGRSVLSYALLRRLRRRREPRRHALSVTFPDVESENISHVCGELGVVAEELSDNLDQINCVDCLRGIAKARQPARPAGK